MINLPRAVRVFAHREPVDMRKSYGTLAAVVRLAMKKDVMLGDVFVFVGRRRRTAKALWWDGTGMVLHAKKIAKGKFAAQWMAAGKECSEVDDDGVRSVLRGKRSRGAPAGVATRLGSERAQPRIRVTNPCAAIADDPSEHAWMA
ncbi:MAG: IS66 family insertion sequence element accessory protein TnpB [Patescibacteria group bacterium]